MNDTRGERRAETARENDDSEIIDAASEEALGGTGQQGGSGGNLQADLATQVEQRRVNDPEAHESVTKGDHMAQGQFTDEPHPAEQVVSERPDPDR